MAVQEAGPRPAAGARRQAHVDDAATRLLRQQERQSGRGEPERYRPEAICSPEHRRLAHRVAVEGTVLLKNRDTLPLDPVVVRSVAVFGKLATIKATGDKGSSQVHPPEVVTLLDGLRTVAARHGVAVFHDDGDSVERARTLAGRCDAVIVAAGNSFEDEGEWIGRSGGDRRQVRVAPRDERLIEAVAGANRRTTVVLFGGSAFVTDPWRHHVGALLAAWYPGMEGGRALADILFGHEVPGGRLPCSWPASASQLPPFRRMTRKIAYGPLHGYRMHEAEGTRPAYPFGFGLGYTTVEWTGPEVVDGSGPHLVKVRVQLHNRGSHPGVAVVQGYVAEPLGTDPRPLRTLRAFEKVRLLPGRLGRGDPRGPGPGGGRWGLGRPLVGPRTPAPRARPRGPDRRREHPGRPAVGPSLPVTPAFGPKPTPSGRWPDRVCRSPRWRGAGRSPRVRPGPPRPAARGSGARSHPQRVAGRAAHREMGIGPHVEEAGRPESLGSVRPKERSTPRSAIRDRNPRFSLLARRCSGPNSSGQASGWRPGSASSKKRTPPGRRASTMAERARARWGTWTRTRRAWTRSNRSAGTGSVPMSCRRTSTCGFPASSHEVSMSVAKTKLAVRAAIRGGHAGASSPHLPHPPAGCDPDRLHAAERRRVEELGERARSAPPLRAARCRGGSAPEPSPDPRDG